MLKKILTTLFGLSIGVGLLLVLGSGGASDLKTILLIGGIGVSLEWIGFIGLKSLNPRYFN